MVIMLMIFSGESTKALAIWVTRSASPGLETVPVSRIRSLTASARTSVPGRIRLSVS